MIRQRTIVITQDGAKKQFSTVDLWTIRFGVQNSNATGAGVIHYVKDVLDPATVPANIDGANANFDLAPGQERRVETSHSPEDYREAYNLKNWWTQGASGKLYVTYEDEVFNESIT